MTTSNSQNTAQDLVFHLSIKVEHISYNQTTGGPQRNPISVRSTFRIHIPPIGMCQGTIFLSLRANVTNIHFPVK